MLALFDAYNRRIRKPRFVGFGRTPASEPARVLDPDQAGSCADAIGFSMASIEVDDELSELTQIKDTKT